jgi:tRNA-2-methylthio-N6-dimethylallyladenosine synthase
MVAKVSPSLRIRFSTSHPKDITEDVLKVMKDYPNICKYIHLPVQSGSNEILKKMNRGYTREWYLKKIETIRKYIPDCGLSTDIIAGFCDETEKDHKETLSLMNEVKFDFAYMFAYSERPNTPAERKFKDNVPEDVKKQRLQEIIQTQQQHSAYRTRQFVGKTCEVLIEGNSRKSDDYWMGRNSQNTVVVFPKNNEKPGDYVNVFIDDCTSTTLIGHAIPK